MRLTAIHVTRGLILLALGLVSISHAEEAPAPLILVLPDSTEFDAGKNFGLIGFFIDRAENRRTGAQVETLRKSVDASEIAAKAQQAFACVGIADMQGKCRDVQLASPGDDVSKLIRDQGLPGAVTVRLTTLMSDYRYWARATVIEYSTEKGKLKAGRHYSASYETRAPQDVIASAAGDATVLQRYWSEGSPSRLHDEVVASFSELRDQLTWMSGAVPAFGVPKEWKQLPNLSTLRDAGRIACRGVSCRQLRVVRDSGPRLWIVNTVWYGAEIGGLVTSVDEHAAKNGIFLYNMAYTGH